MRCLHRRSGSRPAQASRVQGAPPSPGRPQGLRGQDRQCCFCRGQATAHCTSNKCSESGECTCQVSRHGNKAAGRHLTVKWCRAPLSTALARAVSPASPMLLPYNISSCVWHIKQMFCVRRVHMSSLKACLQGTGAPAHLQLVQRPVPKRRDESGDSLVPNLFVGEAKKGQIENV